MNTHDALSILGSVLRVFFPLEATLRLISRHHPTRNPNLQESLSNSCISSVYIYVYHLSTRFDCTGEVSYVQRVRKEDFELPSAEILPAKQETKQ